MKKYLSEYRKSMEEKLNQEVTEQDLEEFLIHISFFQHERMIHLWVTLFFVLFALFFLAMSLLSYLFLIPFFLLLIFLLFYITHYFFLENNVQALYRIYDKMRTFVH